MVPLIFFVCFIIVVCIVGSISDRHNTLKREKNIKLKEEEEYRLKIDRIEAYKEVRRTSKDISLPKKVDGYYPIYFLGLNKVIAKAIIADWWEDKMNFILDNGEEYKGFKPKGGESEEYFFKFLMKYFGEELHRNMQIGKYYPDIILYNENLNMGICIEVDEPYTIDGVVLTHIHQNEHIATYRTEELQKKGWALLRFTENQVLTQPEECCYFVAQIATFLSSDFKYKNVFKDDISRLNVLKCEKVF